MNVDAVREVVPDQVAAVSRQKIDQILIVDSRSFLEFNDLHVTGAVNVCCSKLVKKRLQQDKISIRDFVRKVCNVDVTDRWDMIVYDQSSPNVDAVAVDSFLHVLLDKLVGAFRSVSLLKGGFVEFQGKYPDLCEDKGRRGGIGASGGGAALLGSFSQPCLPVTNVGPTRILPFLYLGSQQDAINEELLKDYGINFTLNVSTSLPRPEFLKDGHFMRIPVNDSYDARLLPYFFDAFKFLDKVREANGTVLVHCLMGISRSPTVAIAYLMYLRSLSSEEAYKYVKSQRASISPNFNFLGQLLEFEKILQSRRASGPPTPTIMSAPVTLCDRSAPRFTLACTQESPETEKPLPTFPTTATSMTSAASSSSLMTKATCGSRMPRSLSLCFKTNPTQGSSLSPSAAGIFTSSDLSPTTALAKLSFDQTTTSSTSSSSSSSIVSKIGEKRSMRTMVTSSTLNESSSTTTTSSSTFSSHLKMSSTESSSSSFFEASSSVRHSVDDGEDPCEMASPTSTPGKSRRVEVEMECDDDGFSAAARNDRRRKRFFGVSNTVATPLAGGTTGRWTGLCPSSSGPTVGARTRFGAAGGCGAEDGAFGTARSTSTGIINRRPLLEQSPSTQSVPTPRYGLRPSLSTASSASGASTGGLSRAWSVARSDSTATTATSGLGSEICDIDASLLMSGEDLTEGDSSAAASTTSVPQETSRRLKTKKRFDSDDEEDEDDDDDDDDEGVSISLRNPSTPSVPDGGSVQVMTMGPASTSGVPVRPSSLATTLRSFQEPKTYASLTLGNPAGFRIPVEVRSVSRVSRQTLNLSVGGNGNTSSSTATSFSRLGGGGMEDGEAGKMSPTASSPTTSTFGISLRRSGRESGSASPRTPPTATVSSSSSNPFFRTGFGGAGVRASGADGTKSPEIAVVKSTIRDFSEIRREIEEKTSGKNTSEDMRQTIAIFEKRASEELEGIRRDLKRLQEAHFGTSASGSNSSSTSSSASATFERNLSKKEQLKREWLQQTSMDKDGMDRRWGRAEKQESMEVEDEGAVGGRQEKAGLEREGKREKRKSRKRGQIVFPGPMYRTQSCPGMLSACAADSVSTWLSSSFANPEGAAGGAVGSDEDDLKRGRRGGARRRRRRRNGDDDDEGLAAVARFALADRLKTRNRHSCGSLDFDSCPDISHFRGCQSLVDTPHGSSSSLSTASRTLNRPPSIIEVS